MTHCAVNRNWRDRRDTAQIVGRDAFRRGTAALAVSLTSVKLSQNRSSTDTFYTQKSSVKLVFEVLK